MEYFQIRSFIGASTRVESTNQDRGTLRRIEGAVIAPNGGISSPVSWQTLWGITSLETLLSTFWTTEQDGYGYFLKLSKEGNSALVFYEKGYGARGIWWIEQSEATPLSDESGSVVVTDLGVADAIEVDLSTVDDKAYYGNWVNDDIWFGQGELPNYIWDSSTGTVRLLGPDEPTARDEIAREAFPPCKSFAQSVGGVVFGAGNVTTPERIWMTEPPTRRYPRPERVYNLNTSLVDLSRADMSEITALSIWQEYVVVHTDRRPWIVRRPGQSQDGYQAIQNATPIAISAPNPNCTRDLSGTGAYWFGKDREVYNDNSIRASASDKDFARERDIATSTADNVWNERMSLDPSGAHTLYDRVNGRYYVFAQLKTNDNDYTQEFDAYGGYVWCESSRSISGPMLFPNAIASSSGRKTTNRLNCAIVVTAEGGLMFSDLDELREREVFELEDYGAADNGEFPEETADEVYPVITTDPDDLDLETEEGEEINNEGDGNDPQVPLVWLQSTSDRDEDGYLLAFADDVYGRFTRFARTSFKNDSPAVIFDPDNIQTIQWTNATVARLEFAPEDFGQSNMEKVFQEIRLTWQRDSKCYVGVFARSDYGQRDGYWIGNPSASEEQLVGLNLRGRRLQVTVLIVFSNHKDAKALLRDMTIGYLPSGTAQGV